MRVRKQGQGVSVLINKHTIIQNNKHKTTHRHNTGTETMMPGEGTKGSDIYRAGDGVQVSLMTRRCAITSSLVT